MLCKFGTNFTAPGKNIRNGQISREAQQPGRTEVDQVVLRPGLSFA